MFGGGIYALSNTAVFSISDNDILNNDASVGGGIYCSSSKPSITLNYINGNASSSDGGGDIL